MMSKEHILPVAKNFRNPTFDANIKYWKPRACLDGQTCI